MSAPTSLRTRITLVIVLVTAAAVLLTGVVTIPLVRAAAVAEARERVVSQLGLVAVMGPAAVEAIAPKTAQDTLFAMMRGDEIRGPAASYFTDRVRKRLAEDGFFSGTVQGEKGPALVEATIARPGVSALAALPLKSVASAQEGTTRRVLLALALGVAVAALAGWLLARWLARPLRETALSAARLAAGERGVTVPAGGPAETREVARALQVLDAALAASEGRQREFLLSVSHEIRTPLSAIRGYGEALADGVVPPAGTPDVGRTLVAETQRLDRFVADLLALARLEAEDFRIEPVRTEVSGLAAEAVSAWEGRASTLGVRIQPAAAFASVVAHTDPHRLRQVVDGLVENALRATPDGGSVTVTVTADADHSAIIEVADTGPGLSDDDLAVVFERGSLHARYRYSRPVGTGLGLSIAIRLVARLGGTISARRGATEGTVFVVRIPASSGADLSIEP